MKTRVSSMCETGFSLAVAGLICVAAGAVRNSSIHAGQEADLAGVGNTNPQPVLVELFTSEGCSACPPADRLLIELQKSQPVPGVKIIALGEHVDYWNRLGWADQFSSADLSERQQAYSVALGNDSAYTPQIVVDGRRDIVGGDQARVLSTIAKSARAPKASVVISRSDATNKPDAEKSTLHVRVDGLDRTKGYERADVWLAITEDDLESNVLRGENSGHRLRHTGVVRQMQIIGQVDPGKASTFASDATVTLRPAWKRGKLNAVVFIQEHRGMRILGAGTFSL
jgi:hypothetical protein